MVASGEWEIKSEESRGEGAQHIFLTNLAESLAAVNSKHNNIDNHKKQTKLLEEE